MVKVKLSNYSERERIGHILGLSTGGSKVTAPPAISEKGYAFAPSRRLPARLQTSRERTAFAGGAGQIRFPVTGVTCFAAPGKSPTNGTMW